MAEYKGKTVTLNKPRRIRKGEPGFGKKTRVVFVKDPSSRKVKEGLLVILNWVHIQITQKKERLIVRVVKI